MPRTPRPPVKIEITGRFGHGVDLLQRRHQCRAASELTEPTSPTRSPCPPRDPRTRRTSAVCILPCRRKINPLDPSAAGVGISRRFTVASFGGAILLGPSAARINGGDLYKPGMPIFIATAPPTVGTATAVSSATFRYHEPRRGMAPALRRCRNLPAVPASSFARGR